MENGRQLKIQSELKEERRDERGRERERRTRKGNGASESALHKRGNREERPRETDCR